MVEDRLHAYFASSHAYPRLCNESAFSAFSHVTMSLYLQIGESGWTSCMEMQEFGPNSKTTLSVSLIFKTLSTCHFTGETTELQYGPLTCPGSCA
jgi:hypothetical protein